MKNQFNQVPQVTSLCTLEEAQSIAQMMWDNFNTGQQITMKNLYMGMGRDINPSQDDINGYLSFLNQNGQNQVTLQDFTKLCQRILVGSQTRNIWIEKKRQVAERIFKQFSQGKDYIDKQDAFALIKQTYSEVGINKIPTQTEVDQWIKNNDYNNDGQVSLAEYSQSVTISLTNLAAELDIQ